MKPAFCHNSAFLRLYKSRLAYEHLQEVQAGLLSVDYMEFREKYNQRDVSARQKMRELIDSDANKVTNVFSTLL